MNWLTGGDESSEERRRRQRRASSSEESQEENPLAGSVDGRVTVFHKRIRCPRCGAKKGIRNLGSYKGLPKTYHECQNCGERFNAIERE